MKNLKGSYIAWEYAHRRYRGILWNDFYIAYHFIRKRLCPLLFLSVFIFKSLGHLVALLLLSDPRKIRIIDEHRGLYEEI